jgi:integrase
MARERHQLWNLEPYVGLARRARGRGGRPSGRASRLAQRAAPRVRSGRGLRGIPLNLVQKWLGHAQLTTTAIYADAVGEGEQSIAARMW